MKLSYIGHEACKSDKKAVKLIYNSNAVHYVIKGFGFFNGRHLGSGTGFICRAGDAVTYYPDKNDPWEYYWIRMEGDDTGSFFDGIEKDGDGVFSHNLNAELHSLYEIMSVMNQPKYDSLKTAAFPIIAQKMHCPDKTSVQTPAEIYTARAKQIINDHLFEPLQISELAHRLHLSRCYLRNIFVEQEGISPCKYRQKKRMEYAAKLLCETRHLIKTIAVSVGYQNQLDFSRAFHKEYHVSPTDFRNRYAVKSTD